VQWPAHLSMHSMFKAQYKCQVIIIIIIITFHIILQFFFLIAGHRPTIQTYFCHWRWSSSIWHNVHHTSHHWLSVLPLLLSHKFTFTSFSFVFLVWFRSIRIGYSKLYIYYRVTDIISIYKKNQLIYMFHQMK